MRLASSVVFVRELGRSVAFYQELLGWDVSLRDPTAALLVGRDGAELYLRAMGPNAAHAVGQLGPQYLVWTADDEEDLLRCEGVLRAASARVTRTSVDGYEVLEGIDPDQVPVLVTFPGPDQATRHRILQRVYRW